jgi:hypothetical protein
MTNGPIRLTLVSADNRDPTTTKLVLARGGHAGEVFEVEINPVDLFFNMVENCYDPMNTEADSSNIEDWIDTLKPYLT